jgi:hypothetical protein
VVWSGFFDGDMMTSMTTGVGGKRNRARPNATANVRRKKLSRRENALFPGGVGKNFS